MHLNAAQGHNHSRKLPRPHASCKSATLNTEKQCKLQGHKLRCHDRLQIHSTLRTHTLNSSGCCSLHTCCSLNHPRLLHRTPA